MAISVGDVLPQAKFLRMGAAGLEIVDLTPILTHRKVVLFGLPGAFTPTCSSAHLPSFMRTKSGFDAKGVDDIICVAVNDPHVMKAWGAATGATEAGLTLLADADSSFTTAIGMDFTAPSAGFFARSMRYSMYVENGIVRVLNIEESRGLCEISGGGALLDQI
jgi:peroxiredoxin